MRGQTGEANGAGTAFLRLATPGAGSNTMSERSDTAAQELHAMDEDLDLLSREQLIAEVRKLRSAIREHRDSSGHDLCWHQPGLWSLLPEPMAPAPEGPAWPQFMRGCVRYRQSLDEQLPSAPRIDREFGDQGAT
jgi:hypothetical protein